MQKEKKQKIQKFWDMFDTLDMLSKHKLEYKIDNWFDLNNGNILYDKAEDKRAIEKMSKILLELPEKSTLHIYKLVKEKIRSQEQLMENLLADRQIPDAKASEKPHKPEHHHK